MSLALLITWLMVFLRSIGVVLLLPTINARPIPAMVRVAFSALLAGLLYGIVPVRVPELTWFPLLAAGMGELILGLVMGFIARLVFFAVEIAGRLITQHIGLATAPGIDAPQPATEPLASFISVFATVIYFILGGHLGSLAAFARSFDFAPAGDPGYSIGAMDLFIRATGHVIELGFRMAAPFVAMDFLVTLAFSVLGRAVPRMNVFIISYPVKMLVGFSLLASSAALLVRYLEPEVADIPVRMLQLVGTVN
ncbi:flagellar biosynthetic protein FliR [Nibricoccus sp. IMCC34717]|uniref:flagellar biosynthetic protein FliR n=1 Tax=Nibricoccus sp. IMCC34717 TaxID=3034021 RepID=UPI00384E530D